MFTKKREERTSQRSRAWTDLDIQSYTETSWITSCEIFFLVVVKINKDRDKNIINIWLYLGFKKVEKNTVSQETENEITVMEVKKSILLKSAATPTCPAIQSWFNGFKAHLTYGFLHNSIFYWMRICRPLLLEITKNNLLIFSPTMQNRNIIMRIDLIF